MKRKALRVSLFMVFGVLNYSIQLAANQITVSIREHFPIEKLYTLIFMVTFGERGGGGGGSMTLILEPCAVAALVFEGVTLREKGV